MAKISELKAMIVDLKVKLLSSSIPQGHCPYSYYPELCDKDIDCGTADCNICRKGFLDKYRVEVSKRVRKL